MTMPLLFMASSMSPSVCSSSFFMSSVSRWSSAVPLVDLDRSKMSCIMSFKLSIREDSTST